MAISTPPRCTQISIICSLLLSVVGGFGGSFHYYPTTEKAKCLNPPRTARRVESFIGECQEEVKNKLVNEAYQILKEEVALEHPKIVENDDYAFDLIPTPQPEKSEDEYWHHHNELWQGTTLPSYHSQKLENYETEAPHRPNGHYEHWHSQSESEYIDLTTPAPDYESRRKKRVARLLHRIRRISDIGTGEGIYHPTLVPYEDKRIAGCLLHCVYAKNNAIDRHGWPTLDGLVDFYSEGVNEHGFFMATLRSVNLCLRAVTNKYHVDRRKLPKHGESCDLAFDVFDCISDQLTGYCLDQYNN